MKLLLAIAFILLTEVAFSQTITDTTLIKGRLNDTYYMYDRPANPEGKRLRLLKKGEFVYIAGMVTTNLTPPQDVWYHCVSRNTDGFIPTDLIELYGDWSTEKFVYLKENKNLPFPGRIKLSKLASSQDGQIEDSIQKNEIEKLVSLRKQLDSSEKVMIKN